MAFRLISLNLNGIRSAATKGFVEWTASVGADCMGVQELKAQRDDIAGRFEQVAGLNGHFHFAEKKGYSGVGLYARKVPSDVIVGFGASMLSPGVVEQTSEGGLTIGRLDGSADDDLRRIVEFLAPVGAQPLQARHELGEEAELRLLALLGTGA